ncbi:MAG: GNAT family N-acetyltransferase [Hyphomicrobiaceae bacterium]
MNEGDKKRVAAGLERIRTLEELAFNAWPAFETRVVGGWLLRYADGETKRANSLNAWQPCIPLDDVLGEARAYYAGQGQDLIVRVTPLAGDDADQNLAERGMTLRDPSIVMVADCGVIAPAGTAASIDIAQSPVPEWIEPMSRIGGQPAEAALRHNRMLGLIRPPVAFASIRDDEGILVAWGLAVVERGAVGLFDILTHPDFRRQGLGRKLVAGLMGWGQTRGAHRAYLQVEASNGRAIQLYRQLGFAEAYRYHYRIAPR